MDQMWRERFKGLVVIGIFLLCALVIGQYYASHKEKLAEGIKNFTPAGLEQKVLGVVSKIAGSKSDDQLREEFAAPVKEIEKKANELLEEIKGLPQAQAEVAKKQLYENICAPLLTEPALEATAEAEEE